jgi:hypothetical protein
MTCHKIYNEIQSDQAVGSATLNATVIFCWLRLKVILDLPMDFEAEPLYRNIIVPWYDSNLACYVFMVSMAMVLLFALVGISVANEYPQYHQYMWVPVLLAILSGGVVLTTLIRLVKRYANLYSG